MLTRIIRHISSRLVLAAAVAAVGACHSDSINSVSPVATTLSANTGVAGQSGTVGQALGTPISVHLADQSGNAMSGVLITWTVMSSGGTVDSATSTTNSTGDAVTHWTLGTTAGLDSLLAATSSGVTSTITASATAGAFATLAKVSGDSQSVAAGTASAAMVVKTVDQYGNPVAGVAVTWSVSGGGSLSATSTTSDSNGLAQVVLTTTPSPASYGVTATATGATPVTFALNAS